MNWHNCFGFLGQIILSIIQVYEAIFSRDVYGYCFSSCSYHSLKASYISDTRNKNFISRAYIRTLNCKMQCRSACIYTDNLLFMSEIFTQFFFKFTYFSSHP